MGKCPSANDVAGRFMLSKGNLVRQFLVTSHRQDTESVLSVLMPL